MNTNYNEATDQQEAAEEVTYLDALDKMSQSAVVLVFTIFDYFHHNYDSETSIELTKMVLDMRYPKA